MKWLNKSEDWWNEHWPGVIWWSVMLGFLFADWMDSTVAGVV